MLSSLNVNPLVSVIVLTYNNYELLNVNIESIEAQTYKRIELIIADDGSKNFNNERVLSLIKNKSRFENIIVFSNENNIGTVKNYNKAVSVCDGEIVMPLSADDTFYDKNVISDVVAFMQTYNSNICYAKRIGRESSNVFPSSDDIEIIKNNNHVIERMCYAGLFSGASLYFRKSFWQNMGFFDENYRLVEDFPFTLNVYLKGHHIDFLDIISIVYGENGVTGHKNRISCSLMNDREKMYKFILEKCKCLINKKCYRYVMRLRFLNRHQSYFWKALSGLFFPIITYKRIAHERLLKIGKYEKDFFQYYLR